MTPLRLDELLKNHRSRKARLAYLNAEIVTLNRWLALCESESITDRVSLSQAISGMPHGSGIGDPTGRLATDIASGEVSRFVKQIQDEIQRVTDEISAIKPEIDIIEAVLMGLMDREREVVVLKMIDDRDWGDVVEQMNGMHNGAYSKRTLQRLYERAMEKAYEIVK